MKLNYARVCAKDQSINPVQVDVQKNAGCVKAHTKVIRRAKGKLSVLD